MFNGKKVTVIIAAAGLGKRIGGPLPKQFIKIGEKTILEKAIIPFQGLKEVDDILIVTNQDFVMLCSKLTEGFDKVTKIITGGEERQDSVMAGLENVEDGLVLVHDAARPYISPKLIYKIISKAFEEGAAIPVIGVKDTIRQVTCGGSKTLDRKSLYSVQTPQGFELSILRKAYDRAKRDKFYGTDDAMLVERTGHNVALVSGDYDNIKITTPEDLPLSTNSRQNRIKSNMRTGIGYDVHRLSEGRKLYLCGIEIPFEKGLLGHSDADVALHAIMDALLGAAALGDIGRLFPDNDDKYLGISSVKLLSKVKSQLDDSGYVVGNVDVTIIAQRPKIAEYIPEMKKKIAGVLDIEDDRVNVKGTTTEKLGFAGREEGIAAEAVCTIYREQE